MTFLVRETIKEHENPDGQRKMVVMQPYPTRDAAWSRLQEIRQELSGQGGVLKDARQRGTPVWQYFALYTLPNGDEVYIGMTPE